MTVWTELHNPEDAASTVGAATLWVEAEVEAAGAAPLETDTGTLAGLKVADTFTAVVGVAAANAKTADSTIIADRVVATSLFEAMLAVKEFGYLLLPKPPARCR